MNSIEKKFIEVFGEQKTPEWSEILKRTAESDRMSDWAQERLNKAMKEDEEERKKEEQAHALTRDELFLEHCMESARTQKELRELAAQNGGSLIMKH